MYAAPPSETSEQSSRCSGEEMIGEREHVVDGDRVAVGGVRVAAGVLPGRDGDVREGLGPEAVVVQVAPGEHRVVGRDRGPERELVVQVVRPDGGHHGRARQVCGGQLLGGHDQHVPAQPALDGPLREVQGHAVGGAAHHRRVAQRLDVDPERLGDQDVVARHGVKGRLDQQAVDVADLQAGVVERSRRGMGHHAHVRELRHLPDAGLSDAGDHCVVRHAASLPWSVGAGTGSTSRHTMCRVPSYKRQAEHREEARLSEHLIETTVVGSYPQPDWLVDRELLATTVPRVRMPEVWRIAASSWPTPRTRRPSRPSPTWSGPGSTSSRMARSAARATRTTSCRRSRGSTSTTRRPS